MQMTIYNAFWQLIWPDRILHNLLMLESVYTINHLVGVKKNEKKTHLGPKTSPIVSDSLIVTAVTVVTIVVVVVRVAVVEVVVVVVVVAVVVQVVVQQCVTFCDDYVMGN